MRIDQNESININVNNMDNSYISNGQNTSGLYASKPKSKFIKTKAKVDSNLSYLTGNKSFTQVKNTSRKLGWDDYFKSQIKKDDPKQIGNFNYDDG